jgi:hypothetical protein
LTGHDGRIFRCISGAFDGGGINVFLTIEICEAIAEVDVTAVTFFRIFDFSGHAMATVCAEARPEACGHVEMLTEKMLRTAGLSEHEPIRGLNRRLRCRECDAKGKVELSIKWADG